MAITAENLAEKYKITREECDAYGLRSQQTWAAAQDGGRFTAELAPVEIKGRKGVTQFIADEHARRDASLESMAKLPTAFKKDGVVTAGNASGICDGAAALILASEEAVKRTASSRSRASCSGASPACDPTIMGIGPVPAIRGALERAGLELGDMDLVEVNEAFAAQYLAARRSSASTATRPTSTAAPSRSATRSARPGPASPPTSSTSCAAAAVAMRSARRASAADRASPWSSSSGKRPSRPGPGSRSSRGTRGSGPVRTRLRTMTPDSSDTTSR
jgi:hypothetical protein